MTIPGGPMGAYGFSFRGVVGPLLSDFPDTWREINIRQVLANRPAAAQLVTQTNAEFALARGVSVAIERDPARATFYVPELLDGDELAHPYLVSVAAVHAYWRGFETFHAGGFIADNKAWIVLADRQGGKSSLMAALSAAGHSILSDDLIVTDHDRAFAGPRTIEMRGDAAEQFPGSRNLGVVGDRPRWRLDTDSVTPEVPLGGWLILRWGDMLGADLIKPPDRIQRLGDSRALRMTVRDPGRFLDLAALPMWELTRAQKWDHMNRTINLVRDITG